MYPTLLDTKTGKTVVAEKFDGTLFWWADGNGSCDCNRCLAFEDRQVYEELTEEYGENVCFCNERFIVIDVHGDLEGTSKEDVIAEMNSGYDPKLLERFK